MHQRSVLRTLIAMHSTHTSPYFNGAWPPSQQYVSHGTATHRSKWEKKWHVQLPTSATANNMRNYNMYEQPWDCSTGQL